MTRKHTEVAVGILLRADGALLLSTRPPGKALCGLLGVSGRQDRGRESVEQALRRELIEELGVTIGPAQVWKVTEHDYPHALVRLHWCKVHDWTREFEMREGRWPGSNFPLTGAPGAARRLPVLQWLAEERGLAFDAAQFD